MTGWRAVGGPWREFFLYTFRHCPFLRVRCQAIAPMAVGRREWRNTFGAGTLFQRRPQGPKMHLVSALANKLIRNETTILSKTSENVNPNTRKRRGISCRVAAPLSFPYGCRDECGSMLGRCNGNPRLRTYVRLQTGIFLYVCIKQARKLSAR